MGTISDSLLAPGREWEDLEIDLLLECVYQRYGFDFRGHARRSLKSKLRGVLRNHSIATFSALQDKIMHDAGMGETFLRDMHTRSARLFDDPARLQHWRDIAIPWLRSHPSSKIWLAECIAPEEICTLAILLDEEGIYDRTHIFATGSNESLLRQAATGGIAREQMEECAARYRESGGKGDLPAYFQVSTERAILIPRLRANITWAQFNLQSDASFNEFHLIVCRHVLPDYGAPLQSRILHLFHDSLPMFGQLSIDDACEIEPPPFSNWFRPLTPDHGLYKRIT